MSDLPEEFDCTITNWEYIYGLCRDVAGDVREDAFEPDVVVALARGGWFAGRCICDFLGLNDLTSLKMEHYVGAAQKSGEPEVRYPMPEESVEGKDVLIIDDIADTGGSIERAHEYVEERGADSIRTATLQLLGTSEFQPDYVGERLQEWTWVVYPWNFIEDMVDLISRSMERADADRFTEEEIRDLLSEYHDVDRIEMEIAQPDRMEEVLAEMVHRDYLTREGGSAGEPDRWRLVSSDDGE